MALRVTAAALDSASIGPVLAALGPAEFRAEERPALLLASIWALLNGHTEALPVVMQEDEALPAFRRAAVEYYERSLGRAAPWDDLHAHDREAKRAERLAEKRAAIREALAQLERSNSLNYREGRALQRYWRSSASSFSELRQILDDGNPASPWLDRWGADAVSFVAANCDAGEAGEIELGRQPGLRQRIDRVLAQVDDYARTQALGGDLDGLNAVVEDLRAALREAGPLTLPPPDQPPGPVDPVVARCRELLFGGSA